MLNIITDHKMVPPLSALSLPKLKPCSGNQLVLFMELVLQCGISNRNHLMDHYASPSCSLRSQFTASLRSPMQSQGPRAGTLWTIMPPPLAHFVRNSLPRCAPQCEHIGTNCVETSSRYHLKEQRVKVKPSLCYTLSSTLRFELFVSLELFPPSFTAHGVSIPCSPCK